MIDKDLAASKQKFLDVYHIPKHVHVDETFPLGTIECYMIPRVYKYASAMTANIPFYITLCELNKLETKNGKGVCIGRTLWGPYSTLVCFDYRIMDVRVLSLEEQEKYKRSIYEEV